MADTPWLDAALILVGHGSTQNAGAGAPIIQHAAELRRRRVFGAVHEAFWKQSPRLLDVLGGTAAARVFIVPLFVSEGYFTETVIPRELGIRQPDGAAVSRVMQHGVQLLHYAHPVGTHPRMADVLLARAAEVVARYPFPCAPKPAETALILAGHGTAQNQQSRRAIEDQADALRARGIYAEVQAVFLEETPRVSDCYALTRARHLVVVPFLIGDGPHTQEDIPLSLGESECLLRERLAHNQGPWRNPTRKRDRLVWYGASVGSAPELTEVILDRIAEVEALSAAGIRAGSDAIRPPCHCSPDRS